MAMLKNFSFCFTFHTYLPLCCKIRAKKSRFGLGFLSEVHKHFYICISSPFVISTTYKRLVPHFNRAESTSSKARCPAQAQLPQPESFFPSTNIRRNSLFCGSVRSGDGLGAQLRIVFIADCEHNIMGASVVTSSFFSRRIRHRLS